MEFVDAVCAGPNGRRKKELEATLIGDQREHSCEIVPLPRVNLHHTRNIIQLLSMFNVISIFSAAPELFSIYLC